MAAVVRQILSTGHLQGRKIILSMSNWSDVSWNSSLPSSESMNTSSRHEFRQSSALMWACPGSLLLPEWLGLLWVSGSRWNTQFAFGKKVRLDRTLSCVQGSATIGLGESGCVITYPAHLSGGLVGCWRLSLLHLMCLASEGWNAWSWITGQCSSVWVGLESLWRVNDLTRCYKNSFWVYPP